MGLNQRCLFLKNKNPNNVGRPNSFIVSTLQYLEERVFLLNLSIKLETAFRFFYSTHPTLLGFIY
jgi:hypothetical protein